MRGSPSAIAGRSQVVGNSRLVSSVTGVPLKRQRQAYRTGNTSRLSACSLQYFVLSSRMGGVRSGGLKQGDQYN